MPADFDIDSANRIIRSRAWGDLTDEDLLAHMDRIAALFEEGTIDATWSQIYDLRSVESIDGLSGDGIRSLASGNPWPEGSFRAILTPQTAVYGMARMYGTMGDNIDPARTKFVRICRSLTEADEWVQQKKRSSNEST